MATAIPAWSEDDELARHLQLALQATEDPEVRFHIRTALQHRLVESD